MTYRADIDGLRAIAILLVTVFHFDLFSMGKAGFIGVDVFFVISGFLITGIILRGLEDGRFHFGTFLYRRVRRLYPALIATLVLYLAAGALLMLPDTFEELAIEALLSQLYVVNFYFWRTVDYFGLQVDEVPLLHMWSLAVEEQFYLIFPLFCLLIWRVARRWLVPLLVLAALLSFTLGYVLTPLNPWASFYLLPTRAWELLAGSLLFVMLRDRSLPVPVSWALGPLGLGLIGLALYLHTPATGVPGAFALLPVVGAMCLVAGGMNAAAPVTRLLSTTPFVWIGLISYPLYLVHWPVMILFRQAIFDFSLPWRLLGFGLSFGLAWGIYRFVETPIRTGRVLPGASRFLRATVALSACLIAVSAAAWWAKGLPQRFEPEVIRLLAYQEDRALTYRKCADRLARAGAPLCVLGDDSATPDMLVYGDSHANAFAEAISRWLDRDGRAAYFSFSPGCLPQRHFGRPRCVAQAEAALALVGSHPQVTTVMQVSIWRQALGDGLVHKGGWLDADTGVAQFADQLVRDVQAFRAAGAQVVLVDPFFAAPAKVPRALAGNLAFGWAWPVDTPLSAHRDDFASLDPAFTRAEAAGAVRISLIEDFCEDGTCRGTFAGRPVFTDTNHIAQSLSERLSHIFQREMRGAGAD